MSLSNEEVNRLVEKLRSRYDEYGKIHNRTWFNRDSFEERLAMALENRMNMEGFILAEITNFEKIRERYEKKKKDRPFSETVDTIIEENTAKIKKYPRIEFHPRAGFEITHFYGALSEFARVYFAAFRLVSLEDDLKRRIIRFEEELQFLALPRGRMPARRIEDHILVLNRPGVTALEIERDNNEYLKESALLLNEIIDFCDGLLASRDSGWEEPLQFSRLYIEDEIKKSLVRIFTGATGYGAVVTIRERASDIVSDFRLQAFKKR